MLRHLKVIEEIVGKGEANLRSSVEARYALAHAMELTAEAAKHIGASYKSANPKVRWSSLAGLRRAIAHPYDLDPESTDLSAIWRFAVDDAPRLKKQLGVTRAPPP